MSDLKFTKLHEWIKLEGSIATIGITDYAQKQLGDIVFIELPKTGDQLKQSAQLGTIESTKAASEIYAPLGGEIVEVNVNLLNSPQFINESPYDSGWMVKMKVDNLQELDNLMDQISYDNFLAQESH